MDTWINDCERANQNASEISADIIEFHKQSKNSVQSAKLAGGIRRSLVQLTKDIATLDDALRIATQITERERARRGDLLRNLTTRKDQLSDLLNRPQAAFARDDLLNSDGVDGINNVKKSRHWGHKPEETEATRDLNNDQLLGVQKSIMKEQDGALDSLSNSLARQKEIALTIDGELDVHSKLIGDLDVKTEKTKIEIQNNIKRIDKVSEQSKVCGMWICIVVLILILIVFAATDWGCKIYNSKKHCS